MREILLGHDKVVIVDNEDYDLVMQYKWSLQYKKDRRTKEYARCSVYRYGSSPKTLLMHRVIMKVNVSNILIDHVDFNGLNNLKSNLRIVNAQKNSQHRPAQLNAVSKFKGVSKDNEYDLWRARITIGGKTKSIGRYHTEIEAAKAYDYVAIKLFNDMAVLNFPDFNYTNFIPKTKRKVYHV